jgi:acyl carrier protein
VGRERPLEDAFDIEFPDSLLTKSTFASVGAIRAALDEVMDKAGNAAG